MTLFAVMCAGIFPLIHMGRPWLAFWMLPYPNTRGPLWVNFRSPLVWDFFAISTYFLISARLLVHRPDSRPRDDPRSRTARTRGRRSSRSSASAGTGRSAPGIATSSSTCCSPAWRRRSSCRCTRSSAPTSRRRSFRAGTRRSSRPTSSPAPSSPAWRWCSR